MIYVRYGPVRHIKKIYTDLYKDGDMSSPTNDTGFYTIC